MFESLCNIWIRIYNWIIVPFFWIELLLFVSILFIALYIKISENTINDLEKYSLRHLSGICFILTVIIVGMWLEGRLKIEFVLSAIGAITVFWYWYKTYERDREIEIIKYYSEKYNLAKVELSKTVDIQFKDYSQLLTIWYEEYFLYQKWYIWNDLWNEWKYWISEDVNYFLIDAHHEFNKTISETDFKKLDEDSWYAFAIDTSRFIDSVTTNYALLEKRNKWVLYSEDFGKFLIWVIEVEFKNREKLEFLWNNKDWIKSMNSLFQTLSN